MAYITCDEDYCNLPCFNTFELVGQNEKKQTCLKTQGPQISCGEHGQRWPQLSHLCPCFHNLRQLPHETAGKGKASRSLFRLPCLLARHLQTSYAALLASLPAIYSSQSNFKLRFLRTEASIIATVALFYGIFQYS